VISSRVTKTRLHTAHHAPELTAPLRELQSRSQFPKVAHQAEAHPLERWASSIAS
jgi:hypothetical protein